MSSVSYLEGSDLDMRSDVPEAGIKGRDKSLHPSLSVRCNYMSLPLIPVSGTTYLMLKTYGSSRGGEAVLLHGFAIN